MAGNEISFEIFPTIPDVPYKAQNGEDGLSIYVLSQVDNPNDITINLSDGTTVIIPKGTNGTNGTNGRGITSITRTSGTGAAGSLDTYTIVYTSGSNTTFTVQNGTNGTNGTDGVSVASAAIEQNPASANYKKLLLTLSNGTILDCGVAKGVDGKSVTAFVVDAGGNVTATMSDSSSLSIGNIYGGISAVSAEIDVDGHLQITYPNGNTIDCGVVVNEKSELTSGFVEVNTPVTVSNVYDILSELTLAVTCVVPCKYLVVAQFEIDATSTGTFDVKCKIDDTTYGQAFSTYVAHDKPHTINYVFTTAQLAIGEHTIDFYAQCADGTMDVTVSNAFVLPLESVKGDAGDNWRVDLSTDDLDTLTSTTDNGIKFIPDLTELGKNYPSGAIGEGFLVVKNTGSGEGFQTIEAANGVVYRRSYSGTFTSWYSFTGIPI